MSESWSWSGTIFAFFSILCNFFQVVLVITKSDDPWCCSAAAFDPIMMKSKYHVPIILIPTSSQSCIDWNDTDWVLPQSLLETLWIHYNIGWDYGLSSLLHIASCSNIGTCGLLQGLIFAGTDDNLLKKILVQYQICWPENPGATSKISVFQKIIPYEAKVERKLGETFQGFLRFQQTSSSTSDNICSLKEAVVPSELLHGSLLLVVMSRSMWVYSGLYRHPASLCESMLPSGGL